MPDVDVSLKKFLFMAALIFSLGIIFAGIVYFMVFPKFSITAGRHIEQNTLVCLGMGFAVLILTPVVIGILFFIGVGYLLGLMLMAAYLLMIVIGGITGVVYVSDVALRRLFDKAEAGKGLKLVALTGAFVVLGLVQFIPLLGGLVVLMITVLGIGALKYQLWIQYKAE